MGMLVFIEKQRPIRLCRQLQRRFIGIGGADHGNSSPPGLLRSGRGDLLPPGQLLLQRLPVIFRHTAAAGERTDAVSPQLRSLLDHMLQLIALGKAHIHGAADLRLTLRRGAGNDVHGDRRSIYRAEHCLIICPLPVTQYCLLSGLEPKHAGMGGLLTGEDERGVRRGDGIYKKSRHFPCLLSGLAESHSTNAILTEKLRICNGKT